MKNLSLKFSIFFFFILLQGCYEGWEPNKNASSTGGPGGPTSSPDKNPTPISNYILFEPIRLSNAAVDDPSCFPDTGNKAYRIAEWDERINLLAKSLAPLAKTFVQKNTLITPSDCGSFSIIEASSLDLAPWGTEPAPDLDNSVGDPIHLKAVFWDREPSLASSVWVEQEHWAAWTNLISNGRSVESLHYFVLSISGTGYFTDWQNALADASKSYLGSGIDSPNPGPEGPAERTAMIEVETEAFLSWLSTRQSF